MATMSTAGVSDLGVIGEHVPVASDAQETAQYRDAPVAAPALMRTSVNQQSALSRVSASQQSALSRVSASQQSALSRVSASTGGQPGSPGKRAPPTLARVSAHQYPNLARASLGANLARQSANVGLARPSNNLARSSATKAQLELERRAATSVDACSIQVSLEDASTGQAVTFKGDGERFSHSRFTLKLQQGHSYTVKLVIGSDLCLTEGVAILQNMSATNSLVKEPIMFEATGNGLQGTWTCTAPPSSKGDRNGMELTLPLDDFGECVVPINVKVYGEGKSVGAGNRLKWVLLDFKRTEAGAIKLSRQDWTH